MIHKLVMELIAKNGGRQWESATRSQIANRLLFFRYKRPWLKGTAVIIGSNFPNVVKIR